jgi:two-component system chemotaxis family response regulator WspR
LGRSRINSDSAQAGRTDLPPSFERIGGRRRKPDFAARYGGEEFAILLQGADTEVALRVGERLRKAVEDMLMAHAGAPWGFVSISIGAASVIPASHLTPQELTECADAALYEAKKQGRNRVVAGSAMALSQAS